jgi:hypothetical protein
MTAAALVALLVAAIKAFPVVVAALVTLAVVAAVMAFAVMMAVVVAFGVGIIGEPAFGQRLGRRVRGAAHAAVEFDPGFCQRALRAHADAAADQRVRLRGLQETASCFIRFSALSICLVPAVFG